MPDCFTFVSYDEDYDVFDVQIMIFGQKCWVKGFDSPDEEEDAVKYAKKISNHFGIQYLGFEDEFKEFVWVLESETLESYENWPNIHGVFTSLEALEQYKELHPFSEGDQRGYLDPQQISFYEE